MTRPKVLVVDDEPFICRSLTFVLKKGDYDVIEARDGQEALSAIREHKPDLVFLDVMMPKMSGFEVCRAIKSDESLREIPVVMVTALDSVVDQDRAKSEGADGYMVKPIDREGLRAEVCSRLKLDV